MPIYEFYCPGCHTIFSFFSKTVDTSTRPACPRCRRRNLQRQVSAFAATGRAADRGEADDFPIDEGKMEKAVSSLAGEVEHMNEDDPRQAAKLMRKFSDATGMEFGKGMQEALGRMEAGEDPEKIEAEMGDLIDEEEPLVQPEGKGGKPRQRRGTRAAPDRDATLYDLK